MGGRVETGGQAGPRWQPPMLATLVDAPEWLARGREGWVYERKLDGLRCLAVRNGDKVELWSRNHNPFLPRFAEVADAVRRLRPSRFTLDGEVVAHDGTDFVGFGQLQQHESHYRVVYGVFDLLHLLGEDVTALAQVERRRLLTKAVTDGPHLHLVEELPGEPDELLQDACRRGWEGLVAKRTASAYRPGRSPDWVKLKCAASQELVIGGWTEPHGSRTHLGAVLVGYYEEGLLRYAGKVGTGFTADTLAMLARQLAPLERAGSPFAERVREPRVHWVEPRLVANVAFSEWTRDGRLRHPRYEGLRPDKDPVSVVRERPAAGGGA